MTNNNNNNQTTIAENVTGKKLSKLMQTKVDANNANKKDTHTLSFLLAQFKKHAVKYHAQLDSKYPTAKISIDELVALKPTNFVKYLTIKESERLGKNGNLFSFWLVLSLISRYVASKDAPIVAPKVSK